MTEQNTINMYDPTRDYQLHKTEYDTAVLSVMSNGIFIGGEPVSTLENKLANYTGSKHCISCANGTDALYISLLAIDLKPNDEVITVAHTWISTSEVIALAHVVPKYVEIDDKTFNIDPEKIKQAITSKTKAILPVSLYGMMPDYKKIREIADEYNLYVIEDGAQSFGAKRDDYMSCSCKYTDIATTSFFPSKPMGCYGDGGAIFTNDDELANKLRAIKSHGGLERFKHKYIGLNSRLDTIQASILLVKLKYLNQNLLLRNNVAQYYTSNLNDLDIVLPITESDCYHVWAQYSILVKNNEIRDALFKELKNNKINCSIFYPAPLHLQECFNYLGYTKGDLPITEDVCDRIINLPIYAELTEAEQEYIVNMFRLCIKKFD
jgi:UDP-2-acetamido-2-deoxy-ribo-hexuluronate aminotransferase